MLIGGIENFLLTSQRYLQIQSTKRTKSYPWEKNTMSEHTSSMFTTVLGRWVQIWFKVTRSKSHNRIINTQVTNIWIKYSLCFFVKSTTYITIPVPNWPINFLSPNKFRKTVGIFIVCWNLQIKASSLHTSNPTLGRKFTCDKSRLEVVVAEQKTGFSVGFSFVWWRCVFFCPDYTMVNHHVFTTTWGICLDLF